MFRHPSDHSVLHEVNQISSRVYLITSKDQVILAKPKQCSKVYLKVMPIIISHKKRSLQTYAMLDDEAEHTMLLPAATGSLCLRGESESSSLRTIH